MAYRRESDTPGLNATLLGLGAGKGESARADWDRPRGAVVGLTGLGGVRLLRAGPWIKAGGAGSRSGVPSAGPWVEGRVLGCAGLRVEAEELMVLSGWVSRSTLLLAMQVHGKLDLPVNCCFASTPER